ncbi:mitochondrial carrier [Phlebopus sp. FC_14]|nr:mitochondrial carrier [Phlebopus sp. FC_14]
METASHPLSWEDNNPPTSQGVRAIKDIAFGSLAGMVSKVFEHPFDLTKVRLQSQVLDATARFNGPLDCLVRTWKEEGIRGLYRGLPAPIVGAMAENAALFLSYNKFQSIIRWADGRPMSRDLSLSQYALAGAGAGTITSFLLTPVELVKCKMQVQMLAPASAMSLGSVATGPTAAVTATLRGSPTKSPSLPGPISVLMSVVRNTGFRGLWLGQTGTLIRETGGGAVWFACKELVGMQLVKRRAKASGLSASELTSKDILPWESAAAGACAGGIFNFSLFPADSVKSAMQTEEELRPRGKGVPPPTFFGTARAMYRAQGVRGLYAGCGITVARSIPSSAIIFFIYDGLNRWLG